MPILQPFTQDEKNKTRLAQSTADSVTGGLTRLKDGTDTAAFLKGTKVASAQGFRMPVGPFVYWNGAGGGGNFTLASQNQQSGGVIGTVPLPWVFPFSGSLISLSGYYETPANAGHRVDINRNGVLLQTGVTLNPSVVSRQWSQTFAKGAVPFAVNQMLNLVQVISATVNQWNTVYITIEMDPT